MADIDRLSLSFTALGRYALRPGDYSKAQEVRSVFVSSNIVRTSSNDVSLRYPLALRPGHLGASVIPSRYIASSS